MFILLETPSFTVRIGVPHKPPDGPPPSHRYEMEAPSDGTWSSLVAKTKLRSVKSKRRRAGQLCLSLFGLRHASTHSKHLSKSHDDELPPSYEYSPETSGACHAIELEALEIGAELESYVNFPTIIPSLQYSECSSELRMAPIPPTAFFTMLGAPNSTSGELGLMQVSERNETPVQDERYSHEQRRPLSTDLDPFHLYHQSKYVLDEPDSVHPFPGHKYRPFVHTFDVWSALDGYKPLGVSPDQFSGCHEYLERSRSNAPARNREGYRTATSSGMASTLNGVSVYYASRSAKFTINPENGSVAQLSKDQELSWEPSLNSKSDVFDPHVIDHGGGMLSVSTSCREAMLKTLPFADLIRSGSLEDDAFYQSAILLNSTRNALVKSKQPRHRYRNGRLSGSGKRRLQHFAYPPIKCDQCRRVFHGVDRKRKLGRHRRKVHESNACDAYGMQVCPSPRDSFSRCGVGSVTGCITFSPGPTRAHSSTSVVTLALSDDLSVLADTAWGREGSLRRPMAVSIDVFWGIGSQNSAWDTKSTTGIRPEPHEGDCTSTREAQRLPRYRSAHGSLLKSKRTLDRHKIRRAKVAKIGHSLAI